jgi:hypothetical protein
MAKREWKSRSGRCAVCGRRGRVVFHHIITEQHVRREGGDPWDFRNALPLGVYCRCHGRHHNAHVRISMRVIPDAALVFARELMGEDRAIDYWCRYYGAERSR